MFQNFLPSYSVSTTNSTHHYQNLTLNFDHLYTPSPIVKPATGCMAEGPIHKGNLEACFALPPPLENVENFKCLRCIFSNLTQKLMNYTTQNVVATKYNYQTARASFSSSYSMYSHKQVLSGGTNSCWQDSPVLFMIWVLHVML